MQTFWIFVTHFTVSFSSNSSLITFREKQNRRIVFRLSPCVCGQNCNTTIEHTYLYRLNSIARVVAVVRDTTQFKKPLHISIHYMSKKSLRWNDRTAASPYHTLSRRSAWIVTEKKKYLKLKFSVCQSIKQVVSTISHFLLIQHSCSTEDKAFGRVLCCCY